MLVTLTVAPSTFPCVPHTTALGMHASLLGNDAGGVERLWSLASMSATQGERETDYHDPYAKP